MKKYRYHIKYYLTICLFVIISGFSSEVFADFRIPFSTNESHLTLWNGRDYEPFFIKGMNMGVAIPGKFPGEMDVNREQYSRWFQLIKDAGFNSIRLYTLHYPHFYEVLDSFNLANSHNPLFFFQGVWLEEELENYNEDLFFLTPSFRKEIEENVDCVHGNRVIGQRLGKAWGTYTTDVSRWNMGYIIGREVHPGEVITTNDAHPDFTSYSGDHFAIQNVSPTESWVVSKLNHLVKYEWASYDTQRPVSFSSWPTQDPLHHPEEWNRWEDTTSIDVSAIELKNAPAGYFASYHAYPYYPDYINYDPNYVDFSDNYGPNSYLGYLTRMKEHYHRFPLIIAEFGVPSSWGMAHYSTSGMHHGGFDDFEQGENNIRMLKTMETAATGGGMQFAWMDEWFKRTWVTDHIDYLMDRRILWHNITAAEQNFGLISFQRPLKMELWDECPGCVVKRLEAAADYDFFHFKIYTGQLPAPLDEIWISLDTYDAGLGESVLPNGSTVDNRAEFALHLTNYSAKLYVTEAYDLFGKFHGISEPEQQYRSVVSDGAPWNIVRWKVNEFEQDIQYIGNLKVNYGFLPASSKDAVTIYPDHIHVRIPWSLLHFVDPSEYVVFHDDRNTWQPEDTISDGISMSIFYKGEVFTPQDRYLWEKWNTALDVEEVIKGSYWVMKDRLHEFNNRAIALCDTFTIHIDGVLAKVKANDGVLANDYDLDGNFMQALLLSPPEFGRVELGLDGTFTYEPLAGLQTTDSFTYTVFDGFSLSEPATVLLFIEGDTSIASENQIPSQSTSEITIFPNPASYEASISMKSTIDQVYLFDIQGRMLMNETVGTDNYKIDLSNIKAGIYLVKIQAGGKKYVEKLQVH